MQCCNIKTNQQLATYFPHFILYASSNQKTDFPFCGIKYIQGYCILHSSPRHHQEVKDSTLRPNFCVHFQCFCLCCRVQGSGQHCLLRALPPLSHVNLSLFFPSCFAFSLLECQSLHAPWLSFCNNPGSVKQTCSTHRTQT